MSNLRIEIESLMRPALFLNAQTQERFKALLSTGKFLRADNPTHHLCVYFLPFDPATGQVFMVHHKKAGKWLSPGGHLEPNETLLEMLNREIGEELGVVSALATLPAPFLFTVTEPLSGKRACQSHYDLWFIYKTDGAKFKVDMSEFHETRWLSVPDARAIVTDPNNLLALTRVRS